MAIGSKTGWAALLIAISAICVALVLLQQPRHGLQLQRFQDQSFEKPDGPPVLDQTIHFSTSERDRPAPAWLKPHTSARWTGWIDIPRESEYTLGLASDDGGLLYVDDALLVNHGGQHGPTTKDATTRLTQGYHRVRIDYFQAAGGAAMKFGWRRSGNDANYEIVPISMLYPEEPAPIGWGERALRLAPWLLLAIVVWITRGRAFPVSAGSPRRAYIAAAAVFALALGARLFDFRAEGETCDEWTYVSAGYVYAQNVAAGITDAYQWGWNHEHPSIAKLIYGAVQFVFGLEMWKVYAAAALLGAATVLSIFWTGVRLFGLEGGLAAGVTLALVPSFLAHGRIAGLDTPGGLFFVLAMAFLVRALQEEHDRSWSLAAMTVVTGLAIGCKLSNVFVLPLEAMGVVALAWPSLRERRWPRLPLVVYLFPILIVLPVIGTWPWLWTSPLDHWAQNHRRWEYSPLDVYFGKVGPPPPQYFFVAFAFVMPAGLIPFFLTGLTQPFRKRPALMGRPWWGLLLAWFLIPFAWTFAGWRMNGVRYVLNAFPPFALLCGAGFVILLRWLEGRLPHWKRLLAPALGGVATLYLLAVDAYIHPYYLDYFSETVGGTKHVDDTGLLGTGWWGEGIGPAIDWVNAHAEPGATWYVDAWSPPGVLPFRRDMQRDTRRPDFVVKQSGPDFDLRAYDLKTDIRAAGAPLVRVYQRRR